MIANPTQTPDEMADIGLAAARVYIKVYRDKLRSVHNIFDDDIESWASKGVMDAILAFGPEHGAKFGTYCRPRIIGAILDGMRDRSGHRRSTGSRKINTAGHHLYEEVQPEGNKGGSPVLLVDILPGFRETTTKELDLRYAIDERLKHLSPTQALVVRMYFMENWTLKETGKVIGVSASRVSEIVKKLRPRLVRLFRDFIQEAPCQKQQK